MNEYSFESKRTLVGFQNYYDMLWNSGDFRDSFVFRHNNRFYMMHVGFDEIGYQTALATSDDLLNWSFEAVILPRLEDSECWDRIGAAGSWILLKSNEVQDVPVLRKIDGKYWMIYHAYPDAGYEAGGAVMGLAWTADDELKEWTRLEMPIFTYEDGADWENEGLYKCCFLEYEKQFWMFYNAKAIIFGHGRRDRISYVSGLAELGEIEDLCEKRNQHCVLQ